MDKNFYNTLAKFFLNDIKMIMNKYKISIKQVFEIISTEEVFILILAFHEEAITRYTLKKIWSNIFEYKK